MVEENKDLNKGQSVADADLNKGQSVAGQDLTQPVTDEQDGTLADGDDEDSKTVKYIEFKKANEGKKAAEEEAQLLRNQMALIAANQTNQATQAVQPQQPVPVYDQAKADLGLAGVEYLDEKQRSTVYTRVDEINQLRSQQNAAVFANQQFEASHPDFGSVVGFRNPVTGIQPTAEIVKILTEKPYLTAAALASSQGAYEIVMEQRRITELQQQNTVQGEHLKQQGIDTELAPVSGAAAGGGAISSSPATVTIAQQQEMEQRVASGEFNQKG